MANAGDLVVTFGEPDMPRAVTYFAALEAALGALLPLNGRVLWSCVNALRPDMSGLAVGFETSAAEEVAKLAPGARVVAGLPPFASALASGSLAYLAYGSGAPRDIAMRLLERGQP